jgi:hypothetical protein
MATIMMAMEHFNSRNSLVVQELSTDLIYRDCPVQFDYNAFQVFDTGTITHGAIQSLAQSGDLDPCVVIGPYNVSINTKRPYLYTSGEVAFGGNKPPLCPFYNLQETLGRCCGHFSTVDQ